jgi:site-specific DNA recombinase
MTSTRAAIYTRVSTTMQVIEGVSLDEQAHQAEQYALSAGWEIVATYREEGRSARTTERPEFQRMLADAEARRFSRLVVPALDRFGRNTRNTLNALERLEKAGVEVIFLREAIDTSTATGRFLRTMLAGVAEMEAENTSARVRDSIAARAREGRGHGGEAGYGYTFGGKRGASADGVRVIVPREAAIVRRMFDSFVGGTPISTIAKELNDEGVPAPRGGAWMATNVGKILRRPLYRGTIVHGTGDDQVEYEGKHTPIVDTETWERAQAIRESRKKVSRGPGGRPPAGDHLLPRGLLKCTCGEAMIPRSWTRRGTRTESYVCAQKVYHGRDACPQPNLRREEVDTAVRAYFAEYLDLAAIHERVVAARAARDADHRACRDAAEREAVAIAAKIEKIEADYLDKSLPPRDYARLHRKLSAQHAKALDRAALLAEHEHPVDVSEDHILRLVADIGAADTVPALRVALAATFAAFSLRRWDDLNEPVPLDLGLAAYALVPTIRLEAIGATVTVEDEEGADYVAAIPDTTTFSPGVHYGDGGTSRYWRANLAISAKAGAATTPPQIAPRGSSTVTSMTSLGSFAGTMPTKDAT